VVSNLVAMPGYVNDSPKFDVVLDTGASVNILAPERAAELKLKSTASTAAAGIAKGQDETVHFVNGVKLSWGPEKRLELTDQQIATLPIGYVSQQTGHAVDALFGSSVFQTFQVRVNYERSEVTFSQGHTLSTEGTPIPITLSGGVPMITAILEAQSGEKIPAPFLVDSGTTGTMILSRKFLETHPAITAGHTFVETASPTAVGGTLEIQLLRITGLDIGTFHFNAPIAVVPRSTLGVLANANLAGFVGAGILSRFTIDWDYEHKTMGFTPNSRYTEPFESDASGMRLIAEGLDWKIVSVAAVIPSGPAAQEGIQANDVIQELNGKTVPPLWELTSLLSHPGQSVELTILRGGVQKKITLQLRRLV
jgi:predicted aspartyl protease